MASSQKIYQILRTRRDFLTLKERGKKIKTASWFFVTAMLNEMDSFRIGFVISKKVGNAVTRNKLRRWGREYLRKKISKTKSVYGPYDIQILFLAQPADFYKKIAYSDFSEAMDKVFERLQPK